MENIAYDRLDFLTVDSREKLTYDVNKVYFVGNKEEYEKYYESIADDIFECSDKKCVVYRKKSAVVLGHPDRVRQPLESPPG